MSEPTQFDYWLCENSMSFNFQISRLKDMGIQVIRDGFLVMFAYEGDMPLGKFLNGKTYNALTWTEIVDTIPPVQATIDLSTLGRENVTGTRSTKVSKESELPTNSGSGLT